MSDRKDEQAIGPETPIRTGLIMIICGGIFSALLVAASCVWWASKTTTQLETIITTQAVQAGRTDKLAVDVETLKADMAVLQKSGSVTAQQAIADIIKLRQDFELHKALTAGQASK